MLPTVTVYTDGACSGNPGPGGWAAILLHRAGDSTRERELAGAEPQTTNNRMELRAVVEALAALTQPCTVLIHTDSAYVANAFTERWIDGWQRRGWMTAAKKPVKNRDLWEGLLREMERHEVKFIKVKGHAGDPLNERADQLAVSAMRALPTRR
ncbi:ribonuclease HI [soil metagenome]